jgi:apolipoprotein D and lipocalin family protein
MLILGLCAFWAACTASRSLAPLDTVPGVDLARYQGKWYEIARLPAWFQRDCRDATATYQLLASGKVEVINTCVDSRGRPKVARGYASLTAQGDPARLEVVFDNWFSRLFPSWTKGQYWIVHLGGDYDTAAVGTPDRKYLWILAREPALAEEAYTAIVARCRALGFDTAALVRNHP